MNDFRRIVAKIPKKNKEMKSKIKKNRNAKGGKQQSSVNIPKMIIPIEAVTGNDH